MTALYPPTGVDGPPSPASGGSEHDVRDRMTRIEQQLDLLVADAARREAEREPLRDLAAEVGVLSLPAVESVTRRVADLDDRGYLRFVRSSGQVVDRIVTSFDEDDVIALGDNVVLMLETLRDLTQPEILRLLRGIAGSVSHGEPELATSPPSTVALLRQLRDPEVRAGLGRVLDLMRTLGSDQH